MKKRFFAIIMTVVLVFTMLSGTAFSVFAEDAKHPCNDADCTVCKVAELINALPEAENITVDNAATVLAQIHAIDRIKFNLSDDEYDELLPLIERGPNDSGNGLDEPVRYKEAAKTVTELGVGGSLAITKEYSVTV